MQITVYTFNDQIVTVQVDGHMTIETLKAIVEAESGIPGAQQALVANNRVLTNELTLEAAGVKDGDVLQVAPAGPPAGAARQQQQQQAGPRQRGGGGSGQQRQPEDRRLEQASDGSAVSPAAFAAAMKENTMLMSQIQGSVPELYRAIMEEDLARMQEVLRMIAKRRREAEETEKAAANEEAELHRRLAADPFDIDAQRRIEEIIQQKNIEENFMSAMEHNPEVFAQVNMLYVDMEVNGVKVKAFIDSGAQMTIMTSTFVEQCFLARLMDKRFKGMAVGVGSSAIVGRVHQAPIKVAGHFMTCSITVLDQKTGPQFIFGLDMLKRHACCINLKKNVMEIGSISVEVPFLPDHEIPRDMHGQIESTTEEEAAQSMSQAKHTPGEAGNVNVGGSSSAAANTVVTPPTAGSSHAAAAPAPAAPAAPAGGPSPAVQQLMGLGFSQQECEQALQLAGGNVEAAAAMLTFG